LPFIDLTTGQVFALQVSVGIVAGFLMLVWAAYQIAPQQVNAWLDVGLASLVGGVVGGRVLYVLYDLDYYRDYPGDIIRVWHGGLDWHGAVLGGLVAAYLLSLVREVNLNDWLDGAALAVPFGVMAVWWACREAGCGYGLSGNDVADWPDLLTGFLPDANGNIERRFELQIFGILSGLVIFGVAVGLTWYDRLRHARFWLILSLNGAVTYLLSYGRANQDTLRDERMWDLTLAIGSLLIAVWVLRDRNAPTDHPPQRVDVHGAMRKEKIQ
jgi:phosphatidylglycerol:prolipoprotein diacylglycerol transferase